MSDPIQTWCWYCKQEIPPEAEVCPFCGKPLNDTAKVVRCRKCGKFLLKSAEVCDACGEPQGAREQSEAAQEMRRIPETLDMLDALEEAEEQAREPSRRLGPLLGAALAAVALLAVLIIFVFRPGSRSKPPEEEAPVYCADDAHQWQEADCTHPRTCSVCGKTEGEPLGHIFLENVCMVCGAYEKPFYFFDSASERNGSTVVFSGSVKNYSGVDVRSIQLRLDLYDEDKNRVASETASVAETEPMRQFDAARWEIRYNDSKLKWKYWRISAVDFTPASAEP